MLRGLQFNDDTKIWQINWIKCKWPEYSDEFYTKKMDWFKKKLSRSFSDLEMADAHKVFVSKEQLFLSEKIKGLSYKMLGPEVAGYDIKCNKVRENNGSWIS